MNAADKTQRIPNTTFEIRRVSDGGLVDTVTTGTDGRVYVPLESGSYYAVETEAGKGFQLDNTPIYFAVEDGKTTTKTVTNKAISGILIHKVDSATGEGIYGVSFILYDSGNNPITQETSDDRGYVRFEGLEAGRYYLRELENEGYVRDTQKKTVYIKSGETTEVEWENTPITEILSAFYAGGQSDNDTARALTARFGQGGTAWAAVRTIPFNTAYKYSAKDFGAQGCYVVGAPDVLAGSRAGELADRLTPLLAQGRRVLLLAKYNGTLPDPPAALDPAQLEFLALLPLQNRIRESAPKTFRFFAKQGVKIKVISGDDPQAVSHVAANAGIAGAEHWVDAATLQSEAALAEAAEKCTVFGRVTPEQKRQLVHALQAKGHTVAMTGDGVNDVLALKDADCGIAMASGAQAASQVAQLVLLDSDFAALPGVVAEGRRVINNIQRSASLFLVKNIFSFLLSIVALALPLAYPFQPLQLSLVTFATIGAPAFFLALEPNHELVHGKFMRNVLRKALPGGLTDFLLVFCAQGFGYAFDIPSDMVGTICTLVILCVGLQILWGVCIPFTPLHWAIWGSMTVAGVGGVFLLARWLPLVRLDLGGTLVLVVLLALSAPTLAGLVFMGERLRGMVNDWKNKKARKHV